MPPVKDLDRELALRLRIEALMAEYVHCIDADRLEEWPDLFAEDGRYRVTTRENFDLGLPVNLIGCNGRAMMRDRIVALRTANIYEPHVYCHNTGALRLVGSEGGRHRTQSTFTVVRTAADGEMSVFACGRYFDSIVAEGETLRFAERTAILDSHRIDTLLVIPV